MSLGHSIYRNPCSVSLTFGLVLSLAAGSVGLFAGEPAAEQQDGDQLEGREIAAEE